MKKNLSLILALVMILGSFSSVFAAVAPVETPVDAGAFLKDKGVLVGNAEGDLMLDELLARQDAVILVAQLRGMVEAALAYPGDAGYEDVKDPFYNGPLKWAKDEGLFVGRTDKVFGFDDNLTVQEYAKVLLTALGYSVGPNGGVDIAWDKALDKAEEFGILANLKDLVETDGVKRGDMALMTFNALSVMMKDGKMTLAENLKIEMPEAKELTAVVKDTVNLKEVVLELSNAKLVDSDKLMDKNNYRVEKFKVEDVTLDGNNVILLLEESLIKNRTYELTVRGLDRAVDKAYKFKANDNESPKVVSVEVLGEYGIKVTTSEPVEDPQERDFLVDGKNVAMNLETYGRDIILTPYHNTAFSANVKELTVEGLQDYAGYKSALVDFDIEMINDKEAPKVTDVTVDGKVVTVTFDKDIYNDSVEGYDNSRSEGNIFYRSGRYDVFTARGAAKKVNVNKVEYTFEESLPRSTEVTISGVQNHSKVTMEKTTMVARELKNNLEPIIAKSDVDAKLDINNATTVAGIETNENPLRAGIAEVTIEFDKAIDFELDGKETDYGKENFTDPKLNVFKTAFKDNKYFSLYTEKVLSRYRVENDNLHAVTPVITGVKLKDYKKDEGYKTIVLTIENLVENDINKRFGYILEVKKFEDTRGNEMYTDYVEFQVKDAKIFRLANTVDMKAYANTSFAGIVTKDYPSRDEVEIDIYFNRAVDRARAEDKTNYTFTKDFGADPKLYDLNDIDSEIIVDRDGKRVTLILKDVNANDYKTLVLSRALRDKDGNVLDRTNTINLVDVNDKLMTYPQY